MAIERQFRSKSQRVHIDFLSPHAHGQGRYSLFRKILFRFFVLLPEDYQGPQEKGRYNTGDSEKVRNDNPFRNAQQTQTQRPPPISVPPRLSHRTRFPQASPIPIHSSTVPSAPAEDFFVREIVDQEYVPDPNLALERHPKLEDYDSWDDLKQLPVKQMKILLAMNRMDFRGCIEKSELLDKVQMLWEENLQHKDVTENTPTEQLCKICLDAPLDCVLLECGHVASCVDCGKRLAECPICRQYVVRVVRTFKA